MAARSTTRKKSTTRNKSTTGRKKASTTRKKSTTTRKKTSSGRKYSRGSGNYVREEMEEYKAGRARSGRKGGKVKSRKQAVAIGLSEARSAGQKVPPNPRRGRKKKN